jgi:hypothetical protein
MINITTWWNTPCIKCGEIHIEMVKIGAFVMCQGCFLFEFKTTQPIDRDSNTKRSRKYEEWLGTLIKKRSK